MPEAVDSNSIPMSEGQEARKRRAPDGVPRLIAPAPFGKLPPHVQRDFDAVEEMLRAHAMMTTAVLETGDDFSIYSQGILLIHQLIMRRLDETAESARYQIEEMVVGRCLQEADADLVDRVGRIVADASVAAGIEMQFEKQRDWSNDVWRLYATNLSRYVKEIEARLEGDTHLLTVGSLLPWLELKIWKEIAGTDAMQTDDHEPSFRDRLIIEQAKAGVSTAELSQAFGIRRGAVERIIARLTVEEEDEEGRKAV